MSFIIRILVCLEVIYFFSVSAFCASQSRIEDAKRLYFSGYYGEAADSLSRIFEQETTLTHLDSLNGLEYLAFSNAMLNMTSRCRHSFKSILRLDSMYTPDSLVVHPRILKLFRQARMEYIKEKKERDAALAILAEDKGILHRDNFWYAIPMGGGQFKNKRYVRGGTLALAQAGSLAWLLLAHDGFKKAWDPVLGVTDENKKERKEYQLQMQMAFSGLAIFYLLGIADGLFLD